MQTQHTVAGGDDLALNVMEWGQPDGPPIVFIHGWSQAYLCWQKQYDSSLADHFRLIAFDLRGHGMSAAPTDPRCYQQARLWADDLAAVLSALEVAPAVLVGWSYGSFVIGDYLRVHGPGRIAGINLVGGAIRFGEAALGTYIGTGFSDVFPRAISRDLTVSIDAMREFINRCFAVKMSREDYERVLCFNMTARPDVRASMVFREDIDMDAALRAWRGPLLMSHGRNDPMTLPSCAELAKALCPQARVSWYDAAHGPFFEVPEKFNEELAEFVRAAQG